MAGLLNSERDELASWLSEAHSKGASDADLHYIADAYISHRDNAPATASPGEAAAWSAERSAQLSAEGAQRGTGHLIGGMVSGTTAPFRAVAHDAANAFNPETPLPERVLDYVLPGAASSARALPGQLAAVGGAAKSALGAGVEAFKSAGRMAGDALHGDVGAFDTDAAAAAGNALSVPAAFIPGESELIDKGHRLWRGDAGAGGELAADIGGNTAALTVPLGEAAGGLAERSALKQGLKQLPETAAARALATPDAVAAMLEGGPAISRRELQRRIGAFQESKLDAARVDEAHAAGNVLNSPKPVDLSPQLSRLDQRIAEIGAGGGRQEDLIRTLEDERDRMAELRGRGANTADVLLQRKDLNAANNFGSGSGAAEGRRVAAARYADSLKAAEPEYAQAASDLSSTIESTKGAEDYAAAPTRASKSLQYLNPVRLAAGLAGHALGGYPGAVAGYGAANTVYKLVQSPLWATVSAGAKLKVAALLKAGRVGEAAVLADAATRARTQPPAAAAAQQEAAQ